MLFVVRDCTEEVCQTRSEEVFQALIDHGASVNATDKQNLSALMRACEKKHVAAIHVLLKAGADINIADKNGSTSLMMAVYLDCSKEVLQALITHGADVNATGKWNTTPLMLVGEKANIDTIKLLLNAGAEPTISIYRDVRFTFRL